MQLIKIVLLGTIGAALMATINAALNDVCLSSDTCTDSNSECTIPEGCENGHCICKKGYAHTAVDTCTKIVKVDEACVDNLSDNCGRNAYCSGGKCKCSAGYSKESVDCKWTKEVAFGGTCQDSMDCRAKTHDASCINNKCACDGNRKLEGGVCQLNDEGSTCSSSLLCYLTLTCTSGTCQCTDSSHETITLKRGPSKAVICKHPSFQYDLGKSEACNMDLYTSQPDFGVSTGKLCKEGLVCGYCPKSTTRTCFSGAVVVRASLMSSLGLILLAYLQ